MDEFKKLVDRNEALKKTVVTGNLKRKVDEFIEKSDKDLLKAKSDYEEMLVKQNKFLESMLPKISFYYLENSWTKISRQYLCSCCNNWCINSNPYNGVCRSGKGYVNLYNDGRIKYVKKEVNNSIKILANNTYTRKQNSANNELFYYEITFQLEDLQENVELFFGMFSDINDAYFTSVNKEFVFEQKNGENSTCYYVTLNELNIFKYTIVGCGILFPATTGTSATENLEFPKMFFTGDGVIIGKAIEFSNLNKKFIPFLRLKNCSITSTNFGKTQFVYDILKHISSLPYINEEWSGIR
ncbi:hypothetical protein Mgra_00006553 [Meloidogyne graminicola]|uniref:Uncharacterized protein n=1 Tax=Meloidogyne graminicola TaxID=189291 RepID=A0A8S9ZKV4_9BILA|nr:hypothetical protein Mgra_00006553 [Meloidogyne graminicola]